MTLIQRQDLHANKPLYGVISLNKEHLLKFKNKNKLKKLSHFYHLLRLENEIKY